MKFRLLVQVLCTLALLTLIGKQAQALWDDLHVTPRTVSADGRTIRVISKNIGEEKEYRITLLLDPKAGLPLRKWSNGSLYLNPTDGPVTRLPVQRGTTVPMTEKRGKDRVTYTFRATLEQLPRLRFEFWDSRSSNAEIVGGGRIFWFNVQEFALVNH